MHGHGQLGWTYFTYVDFGFKKIPEEMEKYWNPSTSVLGWMMVK